MDTMGKKILAVDDEPAITRLVAAALTGRGFEVITASDGPEALDKAHFEKPDLIVLDIMMPRMDGREVRRRLAADPVTASIPVVFLSAVGDLDSQLDTLESSESEYLTKPFNPRELADYIEARLDPTKSDEFSRHRSQQMGKLRKMVEIMHRQQD